MHKSWNPTDLVDRYCVTDDLRTADPYDIWKTRPGFATKRIFNRTRHLGTLPAAALTLFDTYLNNRLRIGYRKLEYPIVRAMAALALLNVHESSPGGHYLEAARRHLDWLVAHAGSGSKGIGWGFGARQAIQAGLVYAADLPLATITPYALDAFIRYQALSADRQYQQVIAGIYRFFRDDLVVMEETADSLVTSYGPLRDRMVNNAVSYHLFALALLLPHLDEAERRNARQRIDKLYTALVRSQRPDGSWLYSTEGQSFIDCFHSCIVLKNLIKADRLAGLPGSVQVVQRGYEYVRSNFRRQPGEPFQRFTLQNKPSLVLFDLYDNAEMLALAGLLDDAQLVRDLEVTIPRTFVRNDIIYSQVDRFGFRHNANMLRWAVLPWIHALTTPGVRACSATAAPVQTSV